MEAYGDLNDLCIEHFSATFLIRGYGLSIVKVDIYPNNLLGVSKSFYTMTQTKSIKEFMGNPTLLITSMTHR